jgi:uncharacterized membrane protein
MTPETAPAELGVVTGGWEFVTAAYALTWIMFAGYALSLWRRGRIQGDSP